MVRSPLCSSRRATAVAIPKGVIDRQRSRWCLLTRIALARLPCADQVTGEQAPKMQQLHANTAERTAADFGCRNAPTEGSLSGAIPRFARSPRFPLGSCPEGSLGFGTVEFKVTPSTWPSLLRFWSCQQGNRGRALIDPAR
jgi:hypothetical protein